MTYEKGDPRLASVNALLSSQNPGDLTRSLAATDAILDKENAVLTELEAAKILLGVKETKVEEKKEKVAAKRKAAADNLRSEEHTSELQSLMRISYAVLRLKKQQDKL